MQATKTINFTESAREVVMQVAVILQREVAAGRKWALPHWTAWGVVTGQHIERDGHRVLIHEDDQCSRFLWGGLVVHLYKDGSEGYWYNLLSDQPRLFIICDGDQGEAEVEPAFVTANQDEATGYMEAERLVLSVPMPVEMREVLEGYVITHYIPEQKRKRRRRNWHEESEIEHKPGQ